MRRRWLVICRGSPPGRRAGFARTMHLDAIQCRSPCRLGDRMAELLRTSSRVVRTPVADSRRWNRFEPRDNDIVIATFAKCGTTWTQRIVDLLVFQSPDV